MRGARQTRAERWDRQSPLPTLALAARGRPVLTVVLAAAVLVEVACGLGVLVAAAFVVGNAPDALAAGGAEAVRRLLPGLLGVSALFVTQQALWPVRMAVAETLSTWLHGEVHRRVMRAASAPTGIASLQDSSVLDRIATARGVGPAEIHAGHVVTGGTEVLRQWLLALGASALIMAINSLAGLILLGSALVLRRQVADLVYRAGLVRTGRTDALRRATYFRDLALTVGAAKELRLFGLTAWVADAFESGWRTAMEAAWRIRSERLLPLVGALGLMGLAFGLTAYLVGRAAVAGGVTLVELVLFAQAVFAVAMATRISQADYGLATGSLALPAVRWLERRLPTADGGSPADGLPRREIRFADVSFTYPGGAQPVLDGLDLEIPAGRSIAIVGANGAGKTTIISLLARLFEPDAGRITVDGLDIRDLDATGWQARMAAIFQDFVRYDLPVRDNVGFDARDDEALRRAAARAGAAPTIATLAAGWDTVLSRHVEGGVDLSGGQWQRIALARALYAVERGASVLVLDEPTANLDVRAEADLYARFLDLTRGLTTILVSHRFSTVRQADHIVVVAEGRVVEGGTHHELIALGGRYARMFAAQAAAYQTAPPEADGG